MKNTTLPRPLLLRGEWVWANCIQFYTLIQHEIVCWNVHVCSYRSTIQETRRIPFSAKTSTYIPKLHSFLWHSIPVNTYIGSTSICYQERLIYKVSAQSQISEISGMEGRRLPCAFIGNNSSISYIVFLIVYRWTSKHV